MNLIFLDIDGVLNTGRLNFNAFDKECLENLQEVVSQTKSKIVMSSTWRNSPKRMLRVFQELEPYHLHTEIIGRTPDLSDILYHPERGRKNISRMMRTYNVMPNELNFFEKGPGSEFYPTIKYNVRGAEIYSFLKSLRNKYFKVSQDRYLLKSFQTSPFYHDKVDNFIILDDETNMGALTPRLILCDCEEGLTKEKAEEAISILRTQPIPYKGIEVPQKRYQPQSKILEEKER